MTVDRDRLRQAREQEEAALARKLLEPGDRDDVAESLRRLEAYSLLLAGKERTTRRERAWVIALAACSMLIAGVLWGTKRGKTPVTVTGDTDYLRLRLTKPWALADDDEALRASGPELQFDSLERVHGLILGPAVISDSATAALRVRGSGVSQSVVRQLSLGAPGEVVLRGSDRDLSFLSHSGASLSGMLMVVGDVEVSVVKSPEDNPARVSDVFTVPETIDFDSGKGRTVPSILRFRLRKPWIIRDLHVRRIDFSPEAPTQPGVVRRASSIRKGTIRIAEGDRTVEVREGEHVSLSGDLMTTAELRPDGTVHVSLEGRASEVQTGMPEAPRDLRPTWLEYFYHQKPLAFAWSAAGFAWGLLWTFKKLVVGS